MVCWVLVQCGMLVWCEVCGVVCCGVVNGVVCGCGVVCSVGGVVWCVCSSSSTSRSIFSC